tara:strand:- start:389 stop:646 length:258 start_codon:yes stop_codon:yes gene_type:complete
MKKCKACNIKKDLSEFHTDKQKVKDGLAVDCKSCKSIKNKSEYDAKKPNKKHRQIKAKSGNLPGCLYNIGTKLITNVYSYPNNRR